MSTYNHHLRLFMLICTLTLSQALVAFNCTGPGTTFEPFDLQDVQPCPSPTYGYEQPRNISLQLVQTKGIIPMNVSQCLLVISKKITACGFDSITYGSSWPVWESTVDISKKDCMEAIEQGYVYYAGARLNFTQGMFSTGHFFSHGSVGTSGFCYTESFQSEGKWYSDSYEEVMYQMFFDQTEGLYSAGEDTMEVKDLQAPFHHGDMFDVHQGRFAWDAEELSCKEEIGEIYLGPASIRRSLDASRKEDIVIINNPRTQQYAGLLLSDSVQVCRRTCYKTQIEGIVACVAQPGETVILGLSSTISEDAKDEDLRTQLGYLILSQRLSWRDQMTKIYRELCKIRRQILRGRLQRIASAHDSYALLDILGKGHTTTLGGAVVYISKCEAVNVTRVDYENCTTEIPVQTQYGLPAFVDPFTWVLKPFPTVVPCSSVMPVRWQIGHQWYCARPEVVPCHAPTQLKPRSLKKMDAQLTHGLSGGVYTSKQLAANERFLHSIGVRNAVLQKQSNAATSSGTPGRVGNTVDPDDILAIGKVLEGQFFPLLQYFGMWIQYLITFLVFASMVKYIVDTCYRGCVHYQQEGCNRYLCWICWDTVWQVSRIPGDIIGRGIKKATEQPVTKQPNNLRKQEPVAKYSHRTNLNTGRREETVDLETGYPTEAVRPVPENPNRAVAPVHHPRSHPAGVEPTAPPLVHQGGSFLALFNDERPI